MYFLRVNWIASSTASTAIVISITLSDAESSAWTPALSPPAQVAVRLSERVSPIVVQRHLMIQK